jgi:hypothetical protein
MGGSDCHGLYSHMIRVDKVPEHFMDVPGSWVAIEVDTPILDACKCFFESIRAHATRLNLRLHEANRLVALTGAACLFVCASFVMPSRPSLLPVQILRVEVYGGDQGDGATGPTHLAAMETERYKVIPQSGLYWQQYALGYGWGMSVKLAGSSTILVRAVEIDGIEVGMSAWAQLTASVLGMSAALCVGGSFRQSSPVGDITTDTRLRLVL